MTARLSLPPGNTGKERAGNGLPAGRTAARKGEAAQSEDEGVRPALPQRHRQGQ